MCFEVQWIISQAKLVWNICKLGLAAFKTAKHPLFEKEKKKKETQTIWKKHMNGRIENQIKPKCNIKAKIITLIIVRKALWKTHVKDFVY